MPAYPVLRTIYRDHTMTLEIVFATGKLHSFDAVPPDIAEAMSRSSAKGQFFEQRIRGRFPVRVSDAGAGRSRPHGDAHVI